MSYALHRVREKSEFLFAAADGSLLSQGDPGEAFGQPPYAAIFTYSKSPGLLSMPMRGGAIQLANRPGSVTRCIRL
jgi:hypothetical protein